MIHIKLREVMEAYRRRTGVKVTYDLLAEWTGISTATLQSLAARPEYNTRLSTIAKICHALDCSPGDLLDLVKAEGVNIETGSGSPSSEVKA